MFSSTFALGLAALVAPTAFGAILDVNVGPDGQLAYVPSYVQAMPGDIVRFHFHPKNHTVTQSAFETPCNGVDGGFRTGFIPVAPGTVDLPVQEFHVPNAHPHWFYCGQVNHCQSGMVFAINPPNNAHDPRSFEAFKALATGGAGGAPAATTAAASPSAPPTSTIGAPDAAYTTPPPPKWEMATKTVSWGGSVYTTVYTSYEGTPEPTPAVNPVNHRIIVGENGTLTYNPANITAAINDTVTFVFNPKNHTVTQSSFSNPCQALIRTDNTTGFKSGFMPVGADATTLPEFTVKINDTAPIWGYCGQVNHCQSGMVFSINAVESTPANFKAFQQLAMRPSNTSSSTDGSAGIGGSAGANNPAPTSGAGAVAPGMAAAALVLSGLVVALL